MLFSELLDAELPDYLREEVERLLDLKMRSPEIREIPRISNLNKYLDESIPEIKEAVKLAEDRQADWTELNELLFQMIM